MFKLFPLLFLLFVSLYSDEVRPTYLEINEHATNHFSVLLKVPARGDTKLSIEVQLPISCIEQGERTSYFRGGAYLERWSVNCDDGIREKEIIAKGLENTNTDLLLRMEFADGTSQSELLTPTKNSYKVLKEASALQVIETYTWLGITHILLGFDHLMFVFALLLIVKNIRRLLWTITAFTLAHSITLAGATLDLIHMPQKPVEAVIALSILFLAVEIMRERKGEIGITAHYPWIVAFIFGLLHGFGFAGALSEIGLPQQAITLALVFFNVGVELGQILFVSVVVLLALLLKRVANELILEKIKILIVYMIGTFSTFWLIERILSF